MKKEIVRIANELKLGDITTKQAKKELLSLFRDAIKEKINREYKELKPKPEKIKCPF